MDNARFHRMGKLELLCEEFGHELLPLPPYSPVPTHLSLLTCPYSPEYNPIEKKWAHIKKHLKKVLPIAILFPRLFYLILVSIEYKNSKKC